MDNARASAAAAVSFRQDSPPHVGATELRRVLLVDASVHVLHVMKSALDRHGYEVDTALSPTVAATLHREHGHEVVVIDGDAFGRTGIEFATELAAAPAKPGAVGAGPPLVVCVGGERPCRRPGEPEPGWERWLRPVSLRYLVARLTAHFGGFDADEPTDAPADDPVDGRAGGGTSTSGGASGPRLSAVGGAPAMRG